VSSSEDPRKFDGPYDKQITREGQRRVVRDVLEADLARRVPGADADPRCVQVEAQGGDQGNRFEFRAKPDSQPIFFDAGSAALWVNPGGFAVLIAYERDDPTYGLNFSVFNPDGSVRGSWERLDGFTVVERVEEALP
jgi:hypothetical protein